MLIAARSWIGPRILLPVLHGNLLLIAALVAYGSAHKYAYGIVDSHYCPPNTQLTKAALSIPDFCVADQVRYLVLGLLYRHCRKVL